MIFALILVLCINTFVISGAVVKQDHMSPELKQGDRIILEKIKVTFNMINHGDIVAYNNDGESQFSRIIGLPGESIEVKEGQLYRDDREVNASYAKHIKQDFALRDLDQSESDILPPNTYLILDDNQNDNSSKSFKLIKKENIIGTVIFRYYPFNEISYHFEK